MRALKRFTFWVAVSLVLLGNQVQTSYGAQNPILLSLEQGIPITRSSVANFHYATAPDSSNSSLNNQDSLTHSNVLLRINTSATVVTVDETFTMDIILDAGGTEITGVQVFIDFDPAKLEVQDDNTGRSGVQIKDGTALPTVRINLADNALGQIDYVAFKLGGPFPSGSLLIGTITFKAMEATSEFGTNVLFTSQPEREILVVDSNADPVDVDLVGDSVVITDSIKADLFLTKAVSDTTPKDGDLISYILTVTNDGPSDASNIMVTDALPQGITFKSANGCGHNLQDNKVTCTIVELGRGSSEVRIVNVEVDAFENALIVNEAEVSSDSFDPDMSNNSDSAPIVIGGVCGDHNSDELVNILDVVIALKIVSEQLTPNESQKVLGDLDTNRAIEFADSVIATQNVINSTIPNACGQQSDVP